MIISNYIASLERHTLYSADNIGVIQDATGCIQASERTLEGCKGTSGSDVSDWLVLDFQSHNISGGGNYVYFSSLKNYISLDTAVYIGANPSRYLYAGINSNWYAIYEPFDFASLTAANMPDLTDVTTSIYYSPGLFYCRLRSKTNEGTRIQELTTPARVDFAEEYGNVKGIVTKLVPYRLDYLTNSLDCTINWEILSDDIYLGAT